MKKKNRSGKEEEMIRGERDTLLRRNENSRRLSDGGGKQPKRKRNNIESNRKVRQKPDTPEAHTGLRLILDRVSELRRGNEKFGNIENILKAKTAQEVQFFKIPKGMSLTEPKWTGMYGATARIYRSTLNGSHDVALKRFNHMPTTRMEYRGNKNKIRKQYLRDIVAEAARQYLAWEKMPTRNCKKYIPRVFCVYDTPGKYPEGNYKNFYDDQAHRWIVMDWVDADGDIWKEKRDHEKLVSIVDAAGKECLDGVVEHGDLKHDNVLFVRQPRFIDFGKSKLSSNGEKNWHRDINKLRTELQLPTR